MLNSDLVVMRKPDVLEMLGMGRSSLDFKIKDGLLPPPIPLGERSIGYIKHEYQSVIAYMIVGKSQAEIKAHVIELVNSRCDLIDAISNRNNAEEKRND